MSGFGASLISIELATRCLSPCNSFKQQFASMAADSAQGTTGSKEPPVSESSRYWFPAPRKSKSWQQEHNACKSILSSGASCAQGATGAHGPPSLTQAAWKTKPINMSWREKCFASIARGCTPQIQSMMRLMFTNFFGACYHTSSFFSLSLQVRNADTIRMKHWKRSHWKPPPAARFGPLCSLAQTASLLAASTKTWRHASHFCKDKRPERSANRSFAMPMGSCHGGTVHLLRLWNQLNSLRSSS